MILPLISLAAQAKARIVVPPPAEVARVKALVALARAELYPDPAPEAATAAKKQIEEPRFDTVLSGPDGLAPNGIRSYRYDQTDVALLPATGQIAGYSDSDRSGEPRYGPHDEIEPRKVSDEEAVALARRAYAAAGWSGAIAIRRVYDPRGNKGQDIEVHYLPAAGGVPYDYGYEDIIEVNRRTGRLDLLSVEPNIPLPPPSTVPRGSLAEARLVALRYGSELRGEALTERPDMPLALRIWYPSTGGMWNFPPPLAQRGYGLRARAALRNHQGVLAYVGWLRGSTWQSRLYLAVDALTGEALDRADSEPPGASGSGAASRPTLRPSPPSPPPPAPGAWRPAARAGRRGAPPPPRPSPPSRAGRPPGRRSPSPTGRPRSPRPTTPRRTSSRSRAGPTAPGPALAALLKRRK